MARDNDAAKPDNSGAQKGPPMVSVVVAARRCLVVTDKIGTRWEGEKEVDVFGPRTARPGEIVEVALSEVALLRSRGFIEPGTQVDRPPPAPITTEYFDDPVPTINGRSGGVIDAGGRE